MILAERRLHVDLKTLRKLPYGDSGQDYWFYLFNMPSLHDLQAGSATDCNFCDLLLDVFTVCEQTKDLGYAGHDPCRVDLEFLHNQFRLTFRDTDWTLRILRSTGMYSFGLQ